MKVLYIGHYKDGTGWANAAINNILAMDSVGIDVVPRAISFEQADQAYPERIKELEQQTTSGAEICIQHTLPHLYSYDSSYKNIGFLATESSNFSDTGWQYFANLMDELWVPSLNSRAACRVSGVKKDINVVPHSLDFDKYRNTDSNKKIDELRNTFNFIFVGEFIERKNIQALLRAFHSEFEVNEPVNLFIKTSRQSIDYIKNYCESIKRGLKIRKKYKNEIVICGKLNFEDYVSVFRQCHSFVMPSRAEGFCIPALEAMCLGLPIIFTSNTGLDDFAYGVGVKSTNVPCFGAVDTIPYLDNANSTWSEIDITNLRIAMRGEYMKWNTDQAANEKQKTIESAKQYDHKVIGENIKEILNDS